MTQKQTAMIPRSVYSAIQSMKTGLAKCEAYDAVMAYVFDGTEPVQGECRDETITLFQLSKVLIDAEKRFGQCEGDRQ